MSKDLLGKGLLFVLKTTRTSHSSLICISSGVEVWKRWHTTFSLLRPADLWPSGFVSIRAFPPLSRCTPPRSFAISAHPVSERWGRGARENEERSLADSSRLVKADYHAQRHWIPAW